MLDASPPASFFRLIRLVKSFAPFDASSNLSFCAAEVSPRMDPRMPLRGFDPSSVPVPVESLIDTVGWRSSTS